MHPVVGSKRVELAALCRSRGVQRLELFGSAARADFDEVRSDLDFVVRFGPSGDEGPLGAYFGLKDDLEALFGRHVDLVEEGAVRNPYVLATITRDKQLVYAA